MWSVECGVRSAECGVWSVECGVRSVKCGVRSVKKTGDWLGNFDRNCDLKGRVTCLIVF